MKIISRKGELMMKGKNVLSILTVVLSLICMFMLNVKTVAAENRTEQMSKMFIRAIIDGDLNTAQSLLNSGADINYTYGGTTHALVQAFRWHKNIFCSESDIVSFLINRGANVNATYKVEKSSRFGKEKEVTYNFTPLMDAVRSNYTNAKAIQLLVENGANVNAATSSGNSVLHYAVNSLLYARMPSGTKKGRVSGHTIIKYLIFKGANPNAKNNNGGTPFHILLTSLPKEPANAKSGWLDLVKFMIQYGADPNLALHGKKPIDIAYAKNNVPVYQYLLGLENGSITKPNISRVPVPTTPPKQQSKSTIPDYVTEITKNELNLGWIAPGQTMEQVEKIYGKPNKIDDHGFFQVYNYNDKFVVKGKMNNGYKVMSVASYDKSHKTPTGFSVGDSYANVVKKFGVVGGVKVKGEGIESKFKGCTDYTYFSGDKQMVFIVDKKNIIQAIRVEEIDEQKFIEAKRKK